MSHSLQKPGQRLNPLAGRNTVSDSTSATARICGRCDVDAQSSLFFGRRIDTQVYAHLEGMYTAGMQGKALLSQATLKKK